MIITEKQASTILDAFSEGLGFDINADTVTELVTKIAAEYPNLHDRALEILGDYKE